MFKFKRLSPIGTAVIIGLLFSLVVAVAAAAGDAGADQKQTTTSPTLDEMSSRLNQISASPASICPPDSFGYTCIDSTEPNNLVTFEFEDIAGTGTVVPLVDEQVSGAIPIGFEFNYYGAVYTNTYISSNGFVSLLPTNNSGCCEGQPIPTQNTPNGMIAGWWIDLFPRPGGIITYQTLGETPSRYFIVQFTAIQHFPSGNPVTLQYKLFEGSNNIEVHYQDAPSDGETHSAGIENQSGTVGLQYYLGPDELSPGLAVCYLYPGEFACRSGGKRVHLPLVFGVPDIAPVLEADNQR